MAEQMMQGKAGEIVVTQAIPAGYKQTEVGIIPNDWLVRKIGDISEVIRGASPRPKGDKRFYGGSVPRLMVEDVSRDGKNVTPSVDSLTEAGAKLSRPCVAGTLTLVCSGVVGVPSILVVDACIHDGFLGLTKVKKSVLIDYLYHFFTTQREKLNNSATHGGVFTNLTTDGVRDFIIAIPAGKEEQTAIATALSDTDALIVGLEQLIAKKQAIKTATMQQLLTGRTRLPQFALRPDGTPKGYKSSELGQIPEDWEALAIDDCATKVGSGKTPNGGASVYIDAGRPFVRSQNIGWGRLILDDVAYISDDIHNTFSGSEIKEEDVLLNITGASIGRCAITEGYIVGGNVNQHVCIIRLNYVLLNARLLVELINSRNGQKQIDSYQAGGNREGLNFQQVRQLKFVVSNSAVEQTAIATILSDMDNELTALEQKLAKARDLKQGMMQQLLTGRIRLRLPKEA